MHGLTLAVVLGLAALAMPAAAAERRYIVTDFDTLRLEGPIEVMVTSGRGVSARGVGDADMLARIDLAVSARTLVIRLKRSPFETGRARASGGPARLFLTVPTLRRVQLAGAGSLNVAGLDKLKADIVATGSGAVTITDIATDMLDVVQTGAGSMQLAGEAKQLDIQVAGSGNLAAGDLASHDLTLTLQGAAAIQASADRSARIVVTGPGSVVVSGKAACTVERRGSGSVRCGGRDF